MAGERDQVTRTDVAGAVRAMAGFPWQEMLDVQRETAEALRAIRGGRETPGEGGGESGKAPGTHAAIAAASSAAAVVSALEDVSATGVSTRSAVFECSGRLERCANALDSVRSGMEGVRRGIRFWGTVLSLLLLLGAADEIRWLAALWRYLSG